MFALKPASRARLRFVFVAVALCAVAFEVCRRMLLPPSIESLKDRLAGSRDRYEGLIAELKSDPRHDRWFANGSVLPIGNEPKLSLRAQATTFSRLGIDHVQRESDETYAICLYSSFLTHAKTEEKGFIYVGEGQLDTRGLTVTRHGNRLSAQAPDGTYFVEQVDDHWFIYDTFF